MAEAMAHIPEKSSMPIFFACKENQAARAQNTPSASATVKNSLREPNVGRNESRLSINEQCALCLSFPVLHTQTKELEAGQSVGVSGAELERVTLRDFIDIAADTGFFIQVERIGRGWYHLSVQS